MPKNRHTYRVLSFPTSRSRDHLVVFRQKDGQWAWRIVAKNGETIAVAEGSWSKSDAKKRALSRGKMYDLVVLEEVRA